MRAKEFITKNVNLFEINMSPGSLRQLASGIDAQAGMEFEMIVPTYFYKRGEAGEIVKIDRTLPLIGKTFSDTVGRPTNISTRYHAAPRKPGEYAIEPDASIKPNDEDDETETGLEFISPPLPIGEILGDLIKVKKWAEDNECYTNASTGLHINVSVPGLTENLDYVKLVILLGDKFVLDQFGRSSNSFTQSSMLKIKSAAKSNPDIVGELLMQMKDQLSTLANKLVKGFIATKRVSVHMKEGYIEFRSPGGDWLDKNFDLIETTLLRFVVALDAACDPSKYRQEYLSKLYKLLQVTDSTDPIAYFAQYAAGSLSKETLKNKMQQIRGPKKSATTDVTHQQWAIVSNGKILTFVEAPTAKLAQHRGFSWLHDKSIEWLNQYYTDRLLVVQANDPLVKTLPQVAD
ncbi:Putative amidoligase enzyme [uncultured Caudovirales phage]|uniref:Amidoligase enzyme n=1 Tax=uncultured Caudovirales phage TaxID=2100421 RepID=A0A6J5L6S9_9CAUD|nr:Putative amidoligase enzyme [uncultured Caudovirales phage]